MGQCTSSISANATRFRLPFAALLFAWLARFSVTPIADFEPEIARLAQLRGFTSRVSRPYRGYAIRAVLAGSGAFDSMSR